MDLLISWPKHLGAILILLESSRMVTIMTPLAFLLALLGSTFAQSCDPSIYVEKIHAWNKGYTGKMYLDQGWLTQQTSDSVFWRLTATFQNEVKEFKVWDADIINPSPANGNKYVTNVTSVEVLSKCYNPVLYPCQYLELLFMVRFPDSIADEFTTDYDLAAVTEAVTYNDGSSGSRDYCAPSDGAPTTPATSG